MAAVAMIIVTVPSVIGAQALPLSRRFVTLVPHLFRNGEKLSFQHFLGEFLIVKLVRGGSNRGNTSLGLFARN